MKVEIGDVFIAKSSVGAEISIQVLDIRLVDETVLLDIRRSTNSQVDDLSVGLENFKTWLEGRQWRKL